MFDPVRLQHTTTLGATGGTQVASLNKPGEYPFQLSRQLGGEYAYHYYAVLKVGADRKVHIEVSRAQSAEGSKASFEVPEAIRGLARPNASGPSFSFHGADGNVMLSAVETPKGIMVTGRVDGWNVVAHPVAFTRLQPPAVRPRQGHDRFERNNVSYGRLGVERDLCGRPVVSPHDFYTRPTGTRT